MAHNILIIDQSGLVRSLLSRWLKAEGYVCGTAGSVSEAWDYLQAQPVQLVCTDVNMPGATGIDLLHRVRSAFPDTAVMIQTGIGETSMAVSALTEGASGYLIKPVAREDLIFQVRRALELRQLVIERRIYTASLEDQVCEKTRAIRRAYEETIHRLLAASAVRDQETGAHLARTGLLSEKLAVSVGWDAASAECLRMAAPMHDVGKIGIADAILRKPGRLTPDEIEIMQGHTRMGAQMLANSESPVLQMAEKIALCHHERWDGTGYPTGLAGEDIPECARIVSLVDVYDALTHDRVYRAAMSEEEALGLMLEGDGTQFEPRLLEHFIAELPVMRRICEENPDHCAFQVAVGSGAASPGNGLLTSASYS